VTSSMAAASILLHLVDNVAAAETAAPTVDPVLSLTALAAMLGVSLSAAQRAAATLVDAGVVTATATRDGALGLALARMDPAGDGDGRVAVVGAGAAGAGAALLAGGGGGGAAALDDPPEAIALWRGYVEGMLTNLGPQSLDALHGNLTRFTAFSDYPCEWASRV